MGNTVNSIRSPEDEEVAANFVLPSNDKVLGSPTTVSQNANTGSFSGTIAKTPETKEKLMFQVKDPTPTFIGRDIFLKDLHKSILDSREKIERISILSQTFAITGLGGIGKSEVARMYIKKFVESYDTIVWIDAGRNSYSIETQFESLASLLITQNDKPQEFSLLREQVYQKLCQKPRLLIIFDNAEELDDTGPHSHSLGIRQFLSQQTLKMEPPVVLITSRKQNWYTNAKRVSSWTTDECIRFILLRLRLEGISEERENANELAELVDRQPIAIELALSLIAKQTKLQSKAGTGEYGIRNLITEINSGGMHVHVFRKNNSKFTHVTAALLNVIGKIKQSDHGDLAIRLMVFMAFLSPKNIPKNLIPILLQKANEEQRLSFALDLLQDYSIIKRSNDKSRIEMHSVIQKSVSTCLSKFQILPSNDKATGRNLDDELIILNELTNRIIKYTKEMNPNQEDYSDTVTNMVHLANYMIRNSMTVKFYDYIEYVADFVKSLQVETAIEFYQVLIDFDVRTQKLSPEKTIKNLEAIAIYQFDQAMYETALDTFNEIFKLQLDTNSDITAQLQVIKYESYIAHCLSNLGKNQEALKLYNVVQKDIEKTLGPLHQSTITAKLHSANCLKSLNKYEEALNLYHYVLDSQNSIYKPLHPDILATKNNIALCLSALGNKRDALSVYLDVLEDRKMALEPLHPDILATKFDIAVCLSAEGKTEKALKLFSDVLEAQEKIHDLGLGLGPRHPDLISIKNQMAPCLSNQGRFEEALNLYCAVLEEQEKLLGPLHPEVLKTKNYIALCLIDQGKPEKAMTVYDDLLEAQKKVFGPLHPDTLATKVILAHCLSTLHKKESALIIYQDVVEEMEQVLGSLHPNTLTAKMNKAGCVSDLGNYGEALKLYNDVLEGMKKTFGLLHPTTIRTKRNIANCLSGLGKKQDALELYEAVLKDREQVLGPHHPNTLLTKRSVANCLNDLGRRDRAIKLYYDVLKAQEEILGPLHSDTLITKTNLAVCLRDQGKKEEAWKLHSEVLEAQEEVLGALHPDTLTAKFDLAVCLKHSGQTEEALKLYNSVLVDREHVLGPCDPDTIKTKRSIAKCLSDLGKIEEAKEVYKVVLEAQKKIFGVVHPDTLLTRINIANCQRDLNQMDDAMKLYHEVLEAQEKTLGALHLDTLTTKRNIALCLTSQGKTEEAIKLNYVVLEAQEKILGPLYPDTLTTKNRIALCLSDLGKKVEALKVYNTVLETQEKILNPLHPDILKTKMNIANCQSCSDTITTKSSIAIFKIPKVYVFEDLTSGSTKLIPQHTFLSKARQDNDFQGKINPAGEKYVLNGKSPGKVLIINCRFERSKLSFERQTSALPRRIGTDEDMHAIDNLFAKMGCQVMTLNSPTYKEWAEYLEKFKSVCAKTSSAFIAVFVLTHGSKDDTLYTDDGVPINLYHDVVYPFNNKNFREFVGKPKLFFIQACQSGEMREDVDTFSDALISTFKKRDQTSESSYALGSLEDIFVGRAASPLGQAYVHRTTGSFYIQAIISVFERYCRYRDLVTMHNMVQDMVKESVPQTPYATLFAFKLFRFPYSSSLND